MVTKYDIVEIVFISGKVVEAHIGKDGTYYKVTYNDKYGSCVEVMNEEQLWSPASTDKPKEETNATT